MFTYNKNKLLTGSCSKYIIILIAFSPLLVAFSAFSQDNYSVRSFSKNDSLAQDYVYSIIQDVRGFLWVGTGDGLSRYDGKNIANFRTPDGLGQNFVTASTNDQLGNIYFGHLDGKISIYKGYGFDSISVPIKGKVTDLLYDGFRDVVWALYQNGNVLRIKNQRAELVPIGVLNDKSSQSLEILQDYLYVGTNEGLAILPINEVGDITDGSMEESLSYVNVTSLYKTQDKKEIWIGTEEAGIHKITIDKTNSSSVTKIFGSLFDQYFITHLLVDHKNNLWVSTRVEGLLNVTMDLQHNVLDLTHFKNEGSLQSPSVLYEDIERNIWAGSMGEGLKQFVPNQFTFLDLKNLTGDNVVLSGAQVSKNEYMIATDEGLLKMIYNEESKEHSFLSYPRHDLRAIKAQHLFTTSRDNIIWIGLSGKGAYTYDKVTEKLVSVKALENSIVKYVVKDYLGNSWVSVETEGVFLLDSKFNIIKKYNTSNGLLHNDITTICVDKGGNVWFGSMSTGLFRLTQDEVFEYWTKDGRFPSYSINDIKEDLDSNLWVATDGNGVFRINEDLIATFSSKSGLLSDYGKYLICDDKKNVWVVHRKGLSRINVKQQIKIEAYSSSTGFKESDTRNALYFNDTFGDSWFAQNSTLIKYNSRLEESGNFEKKVFLTDVRLFYKHEDLSPFTSVNHKDGFIPDQLKLPHDKNHVTFDFIAVSLRDRNSLYYRHRLFGYESEWSPPTKDNSSTYTNLSPGKYSIFISVSDNPNLWTDDYLSYDITILKPYWQRWWFYGIQIIVIGLLFYITYSLSKNSTARARNIRILRVMVYILIFIIFEYLELFLGPLMDTFNNGAPIIMIIINLLLALLLLPVENLLRRFFYLKDKNASESIDL